MTRWKELPAHLQGRVKGPMSAPAQRSRSGGRRPTRPGRMNKTESAYAEELDLLQRAGRIRRWYFEPFSLRLAKRTFYRPDFLVEHDDGTLEVVEIKGHWEDDSRVKVKVAAEMFPMFRFTAIRGARGKWEEEYFDA